MDLELMLSIGDIRSRRFPRSTVSTRCVYLDMDGARKWSLHTAGNSGGRRLLTSVKPFPHIVQAQVLCLPWKPCLSAVREVVGEPAVICGNSIGALAALSAAAAAPDFARGLVMLNAAGRFDAPESTVANPAPTMESDENPVAAWFKGLLARVVSGSIFFSTKYRIGPILKQVRAPVRALSSLQPTQLSSAGRNPALRFVLVLRARARPDPHKTGWRPNSIKGVALRCATLPRDPLCTQNPFQFPATSQGMYYLTVVELCRRPRCSAGCAEGIATVTSHCAHRGPAPAPGAGDHVRVGVNRFSGLRSCLR
jgi:hypothetical protein